MCAVDSNSALGWVTEVGSCFDAGGLAVLEWFRDAEAHGEYIVKVAHDTVVENGTQVPVAVASAREQKGTEVLTEAAMIVGIDRVALYQSSVGSHPLGKHH